MRVGPVVKVLSWRQTVLRTFAARGREVAAVLVPGHLLAAVAGVALVTWRRGRSELGIALLLVTALSGGVLGSTIRANAAEACGAVPGGTNGRVPATVDYSVQLSSVTCADGRVFTLRELVRGVPSPAG